MIHIYIYDTKIKPESLSLFHSLFSFGKKKLKRLNLKHTKERSKKGRHSTPRPIHSHIKTPSFASDGKEVKKDETLNPQKVIFSKKQKPSYFHKSKKEYSAQILKARRRTKAKLSNRSRNLQRSFERPTAIPKILTMC